MNVEVVPGDTAVVSSFGISVPSSGTILNNGTKKLT